MLPKMHLGGRIHFLEARPHRRLDLKRVLWKTCPTNTPHAVAVPPACRDCNTRLRGASSVHDVACGERILPSITWTDAQNG